MKAFETYNDLTNAIREAVIDAASDMEGINIERGTSNVSCSSYVAVSFDGLETEDGESTLKIRFSDHADYHCSDISFNVKEDIVDIEDEDGDFDGCEIYGPTFDWFVSQAVKEIKKFRENLIEEAA